MQPAATQIIQQLNLVPLPGEGGYYRETYRSSTTLTNAVGTRSISTAIYYLLTPETVSRFHRLHSDEVWHFYAGDAVQLVLLHVEGNGEIVLLGNSILEGQQCQVVVPKRTWQGASLVEGGRWALMGCTVSPGFTFEDCELATSSQLLETHSAWKTWIERLSV